MSEELVPIDPKLEADLGSPDRIKPQFTPGEWKQWDRLNVDQGILITDDKGRVGVCRVIGDTQDPDGADRKKGKRICQANANLIFACPEMFDAMMAGIRYDNAIKKRAVNGNVKIMETGGAVAMGDDLDALYMEWINKTRLALQKALVGKKS